MTQLTLLRTRRFAALFWTQFLGAFNDNLFKNALVILVTYKALGVWGLAPQEVVAASGGLFILPFFLFSATAGQLADRFPKPRLVHWVKGAEIAFMAVAAVGFLTERIGLLLVTLFLMGLHSTFFGPVKYSILPQLLDEDELVGGNALVETGTFLAILLGTIAGGVLVAQGESGLRWLGITLIGVAILGLLASLRIPPLPAENPTLPIAWNPVRPTLETYAITRRNRTVFLSILGISWFWFFGAALLALLPSYTKDVLHANEHVVTLFLALFCIGIAAGSLLCERLSDRKLELGLVPFGSIGMSVFAFDLFLASAPPATALDAAAGIGSFVTTAGGLRIMVDLALLATSSGFFIVPLYTLVQQRSEAAARSRIIAGNNILGAFFMVLSSLMLIGLHAAGVSIPRTFLVLAILNGAVAVYIYQIIPEFLLRFVAWILAHLLYRLRTVGREHIPMEGPAVLVCNHVSLIDWLVIASACKRPVRFVMYHGFLELPLVGWLFRDAKVIPIAPARESAETLDAAYDQIARELEDGEIVCIFPEGKLTADGKMNPFRPGIERIVQRTPVAVIPMALEGLWGSFFSRRYGRAMRKPFRRVWSRITLVIGSPVAPEAATADSLAEHVARLGGFEPPAAAEERAGSLPLQPHAQARQPLSQE